MALPMPANTTCDVYRPGNAPPAAPDAAGVRGHLSAAYPSALERGEGDADQTKFTHVLLVDLAADVRDGYGAGGVTTANADSVYVPDKNGTKFLVTFVERRQRGQAADHKRVYLMRHTPGWPTSNL